MLVQSTNGKNGHPVAADQTSDQAADRTTPDLPVVDSTAADDTVVDGAVADNVKPRPTIKLRPAANSQASLDSEARARPELASPPNDARPLAAGRLLTDLKLGPDPLAPSNNAADITETKDRETEPPETQLAATRPISRVELRAMLATQPGKTGRRPKISGRTSPKKSKPTNNAKPTPATRTSISAGPPAKTGAPASADTTAQAETPARTETPASTLTPAETEAPASTKLPLSTEPAPEPEPKPAAKTKPVPQARPTPKPEQAPAKKAWRAPVSTESARSPFFLCSASTRACPGSLEVSSGSTCSSCSAAS